MALWKDDPVHMTTDGFDLLAGLVLEAVTGAADKELNKRPLNKPDERPGLNKKRQSFPAWLQCCTNHADSVAMQLFDALKKNFFYPGML